MNELGEIKQEIASIREKLASIRERHARNVIRLVSIEERHARNVNRLASIEERLTYIGRGHPRGAHNERARGDSSHDEGTRGAKRPAEVHEKGKGCTQEDD